ncbi:MULTISPECIES: DUF3152 domain-containing protein [Streptomyces]|uniref:DUF3152 domain-containing protein n=1 Tax=Streptomyces TaxID=1883 RepID=UPI0022496226|nr:DUF3152 domain-containing protein [Streptomyces sp. JHD 1]MCX2969646.1 DUF3152 domain-containing protein [Streptomyces sp. JHD 1]
MPSAPAPSAEPPAPRVAPEAGPRVAMAGQRGRTARPGAGYAEATRPGPGHVEAARSEAARPEPVRAEPVRAEAAPAEAAPAEAGRPGAGPAAEGPVVGPPRPPRGGPRPEYVRAFDASPPAAAPPPAAGSPRPPAPRSGDGDRPAPAPTGFGPPRRPGRLRLATGVFAALVTGALTVLVAGQASEGGAETPGTAERPPGERSPGVGSDPDPAGSAAPQTPQAYEEKLGTLLPVAADLAGPGTFAAVPGRAEGPGRGETLTYRVDVEKGLGLDAELFARAVHTTINDERSWAHDGRRSFVRVDSGPVDFVMTLASPATTAEWCAKSGLDTTVDNVSCDSAATERIMINAYRWGQGAPTYGPDLIREYREMLINHEVGHRLGFGHVGCPEDGALASVMMQQTKTLTSGDRTCRPNAWPHPKG